MSPLGRVSGRVSGRVAALALALVVAGVAFADGAGFPHLTHARLFPSCAGCHGAIADSADPRRTARAVPDAERFPPPELCTQCHNLKERQLASMWTGPTHWATNLRFSHGAHATAQTKKGAAAADCVACHAPPGETRRMAVGRAVPEACLTCHAPGAAHLSDRSPCATCHVPIVAATSLSMARVSSLPRPPSHDAPDFIARHGALARSAPNDRQCATCHSSESCARCHMNASTIPVIAALGHDTRIASAVAGRSASYPAPASHADPSWAAAHGATARRSTATCANCHAQRSCTTCHVGAGAASVIARLPAPTTGAQGVQLRRAAAVPADASFQDAPSSAGSTRLPPRVVTATDDSARAVRVHPTDFAKKHDAIARTQSARCSTCHEQSFCATCHVGEGRRRFHPPDFAVRHSPAAYGRVSDCRNCHQTEAFCRSCHASSGLAAEGRRDVVFHDAEPRWLLAHGRAARQSLETCTTCHQQSDCMRCHANRGMRINPHGPSFDPQKMAARSKVVCITCHGSDPLAKP